MIRLNVFLLLEDVQKKEALKFVATELVEKSLHDKGCIRYFRICHGRQPHDDL